MVEPHCDRCGRGRQLVHHACDPPLPGMVARGRLGVVASEELKLSEAEASYDGDTVSDAILLDAIARVPEGGIREVLTLYGGQLLGRLRKHAQDRRYGDADVDDVFQRSLLRLLVPEMRTEILAAGRDLLPWLSRW